MYLLHKCLLSTYMSGIMLSTGHKLVKKHRLGSCPLVPIDSSDGDKSELRIKQIVS